MKDGTEHALLREKNIENFQKLNHNLNFLIVYFFPFLLFFYINRRNYWLRENF